MEDGLKEMNWIRCRDELPPIGDEVLATDGKCVAIGIFDYHPTGGKSFIFGNFTGPFTHWMPLNLPEPDESYKKEVATETEARTQAALKKFEISIKKLKNG